jgi:hypothetical protein
MPELGKRFGSSRFGSIRKWFGSIWIDFLRFGSKSEKRESERTRGRSVEESSIAVVSMATTTPDKTVSIQGCDDDDDDVDDSTSHRFGFGYSGGRYPPGDGGDEHHGFFRRRRRR